MPFIHREIYTKNKEFQRYLDDLVKHSIVEMPPRMAQDFGRLKTIRNIRSLHREEPLIIIGLDRKLNKSIIRVNQQVKIHKEGDKYVFSL